MQKKYFDQAERVERELTKGMPGLALASLSLFNELVGMVVIEKG